MLVELAVVEQRYRAVLEVLEGAPVTEVAPGSGWPGRRCMRWLRRYAADGGMANLADRSAAVVLPAPDAARRWSRGCWRCG